MLRSILTLGTTLTLSLGLVIPRSTLAQTQNKVYKYTERCWLDYEVTTCRVTDIRNSQGFLDSRVIIPANGRGYYVNSGFFLGKFMTHDSRRAEWYRFNYKPEGQGNTRVSPNLVIESISWD
jgi:hypothetical protein